MQFIRTVRPIIAAILFITLFSGCEKSSQINDNNTIFGSGKVISQTRFVEECSGLKIKNVGDVYLTQDTSQSIQVLADDNVIDKVITLNDNGTLLVGLKDGSYSNITVKIYVSLKKIRNLLIEGAGSISAADNIVCDTLICNINGAGKLTLLGISNYFDCSIIGAGEISAKDFISKKCKSFINGAGNITVYVTEELDAGINGTGTIIYYGNPPVVHTSIIGLGRIIKR